MTPIDLSRLIQQGETLDVEFKGEEHERLSDGDLIDAVVCMSNRSGSGSGWILVGVEDDRRVTGARPRHETGRTEPQRVQALIANRTRPSVSVRVELIAINGVEVLVIEIPVSWRTVETSDAKKQRRTIGGDGRPACVPYYHDEVMSRLADLGQADYTTFEVRDVGPNALDPLEFDRFRRAVRESKGAGDTALLDLTDMELAKALSVVTKRSGNVVLRVAALLLFGKEEAIRAHLPTHEVAFQELAGTAVRVNDFFRWPLLRVMEELMNRFRARYQEDELLDGMVRIGVPNYPERAFREAVANALIHRDYTRLGAVHVQWHDDSVEVSNPGSFPEGVRLDNLLVTAPHPRNPLLADAFKRAGIVERTGRGVDSIFREMLRNGRPAPSYARTTTSGVTAVLYGTKPDKGFIRLVAAQDKAGQPLKLDELLVLRALIDDRHLRTVQAARLVQKPEPEAQAVLELLVQSGLADRAAEGSYSPSRAALAYVVERQPRKGKFALTDSEQQQRVVEWVRINNSINSPKAAEICGVSQREASYLLSKMRKSGKLQLRGARRWAKYVLP